MSAGLSTVSYHVHGGQLSVGYTLLELQNSIWITIRIDDGEGSREVAWSFTNKEDARHFITALQVEPRNLEYAP